MSERGFRLHDADKLQNYLRMELRVFKELFSKVEPQQSPTSRHVKMLERGKILSVDGEIVANMLQTCCRTVGGVPNMLSTCWQQCSRSGVWH